VAVVTSRRTTLGSSRAGETGDFEHLLEFEDVSLSFKGIKALDDVSFAVADGELFAVIGPNGAVKTSIFNCINGVYKPQSGSIKWKGEEILGRRPDRVADLGVARTFQNIELFPHMTVLDNIMLGRHIRTKTSWWDGAIWVGPAKKEELKSRAVAEDIIDFLEIARWRKYPLVVPSRWNRSCSSSTNPLPA
jgi:branched-chain amino acid transport system ATP-binding protein